jgi:hypothetical protein
MMSWQCTNQFLNNEYELLVFDASLEPSIFESLEHALTVFVTCGLYRQAKLYLTDVQAQAVASM